MSKYRKEFEEKLIEIDVLASTPLELEIKYTLFLESKLSEKDNEVKIFNIDCNGMFKMRVHVANNNIVPLLAMNGYGDAEDPNDIKVTKYTND